MASLGQLQPGSKCDRYEIFQLIGSGGMGEVYHALHEFTKKPVALKVLKVSHAGNENLVEKMRAEAMVLCRIKHHNLVEVYDAGIAEVTVAGASQPTSMIWMAMELLDGESLRERLMREGALRPATALEWASQVADGVQAAHDAQVIHRDLKPENIFITKKGDIRVLDFGTAKFEGFGQPQTKQSERVGTVPYMAPEHLGGEQVDARSDVFALGFILYEMLAGRHPFANQDGSFPPLDQLIAMQLAGEPASLASHVGPVVWQTVQRATQSRPDQRHGTMSEMAAALRQVRAHLTGNEASGPVRLSGSTNPGVGSGGYPATAPLPAASGLGSSNATPPPIGISGAHERPGGVIGTGGLVGLAIGAASLSALVVVLVSGDAETADTTAPAASAAPAEDKAADESYGTPQEGDVLIEEQPEPEASASASSSAATEKPAAPRRPVPRKPPLPKKPKREIF